MERCSYFIKEKALFGSFPTQDVVGILQEHGVRVFIDLTGFHERKTVPYTTRYKYIKYPIIDRGIPSDTKSFAQLILRIWAELKKLEPGEKIYIHCKGGHGRSGIVVACVLCVYYGITTSEALYITSKSHAKRPEMREKWRRLGSPQNNYQKDFVHRFFAHIKYTDKCTGDNPFSFLCNFSNHSVHLENIGTFPNAHCAFQAYRNLENVEYIENLKRGIVNHELVSRQTHEWEENKIKYMHIVLENKFTQHSELLAFLLKTGLRPLIKSSKDNYWGDGGNNQGKNIHGIILQKIRNAFLLAN
jgi:predicted NAD-dependent protein-ADP-ribosyltransferase YbiA (DUF1768 family)